MKTCCLSFLLFLATLCLSSLLIPLVHGNCIADQQQLLLHFKKSLVFWDYSSSKLITWNSTTDCCSWVGVTCGTNGHVLGLDISGESISGGIDNSSSLFHLQHLQSLNLAHNQLGNGSSIPSAVGQLQNLWYLNLSYNTYSGQIPIEISRLTKLVVLDISRNIFSNDLTNIRHLEISKLHMLVENLTKLEELYLDEVQISAQGSEWCQAISSSLPNLRILSLSNCNLSGPFHPSFVSLKSLSVIQLIGNNISSPVPGFFASFSNLTFLDLGGCRLLGTFPKQIFLLPSLEHISLSQNPELHGSLPEFLNRGSLRYLSLNGSKFSGSLPDSISNLKLLSKVDISVCNFTGLIPASLGNLTNLVYLDMSSNRLIGQIDFIQWENLVNLETLFFDSNLLSGSIPSSIFTPPVLEELYLSDNQFSGPFPELTSNSSQLLSTLDLSSNNLEGTIPVSIYNLGGLRALLLSSNNFSSFPFGSPHSLTNLTWIDLSYNSLLLFDSTATNSSSSSIPNVEILDLTSSMLKAIPHFLKNLSRLDYLDLSVNQIQAEIPSWIWNLRLSYLNLSYNSLDTVEAPLLWSSSFLVLDIHANQLQGQFPFFPPSVSFLDLSRNNLSSNIPSVIGDASSLVFLSLSGNNLEGHIPVSICNATSIEFLDLSKNSLSGPIPKCLARLQNSQGLEEPSGLEEPRGLQVLNLRENNFTGTISDFEFPENCFLKSLNLNGNEIKGQFPKSLGNCTELELLDIGNNQMRDTFPCMLKRISSLRVLMLRSNKFHGSIECSDTNGTWPVLQIIDLALNGFSGEVSGASLKTWDAMVLANGNHAINTINYTYNRGISVGKGSTLISFEDEIGTTSKGLERELVKINVFTLIDLSGNKFNGSIPKELGELKLLFSLNLSSNAFTGEIPQSFGNMKQLESLDLSRNNLSGQIPQQLAELTFLSVLDLSNNQLVGRIPTGTQFSTFPKASFQGNKDLWGPPLTVDNTGGLSPESPPTLHPHSGDEIEWNIISVEIGFICGFAIAIGSLLFCKKWRKWYYQAMYNYVLLKIFPQLEQKFGNHRRHVYTGQSYWRRRR